MIYIGIVAIKRIFMSCFAIKGLISHRIIKRISDIDTIMTIGYLMNLIVINVKEFSFGNEFIIFQAINCQIGSIMFGHNS